MTNNGLASILERLTLSVLSTSKFDEARIHHHTRGYLMGREYDWKDLPNVTEETWSKPKRAD